MGEEERAPVANSSGSIEDELEANTFEETARQQTEQQQQLVNILLCNNMDFGTEETNCSETMSTNDDAEDYDEQKATSCKDKDDNNLSRPRSRALRERISTPAHPKAGSSSNGQLTLSQVTQVDCDDNQHTTSSDNSYYLMSTTQLQQDETPSTGELSELASSNCLAPPSYGTATGLASDCTALDPKQLQQLHQMRFQSQQQQVRSAANTFTPTTRYFLSGQQQQHYGFLKGSDANGSRNANANVLANKQNSLLGKTIGPTIGSGKQLQQQQRQQQQHHQYYHQSQSVDEANGASSHNRFQVVDPNALLGDTVIIRANQLEQRKHHHLSATTGGHYLVGSGAVQDPLARIRCVAEAVPVRTHLNVACNTNDLRQQPNNLSLDNNQKFATLRQTHSQQPHQPGIPINHLISEQGSLAWQPQTNQYRACASSPGAPLGGRANPPSVVHSGDAGQSFELAARAQGSSVWVMEAPSPSLTRVASFSSAINSSATTTANARHPSAALNSQLMAANRNGPLQLTGSISASPDFGAPQNTNSWQLSQVLTHNPNHNQSHPNQSGARATLIPAPASSTNSFAQSIEAPISSEKSRADTLTKPTEDVEEIGALTSNTRLLSFPLARGRENLQASASSATLGHISGATSRARREQLQQSAHHRKRRRHRSTSGRSMSPAESYEQQPRGERQVTANTPFSRELAIGSSNGQRSLTASCSQTTGSLKQRQQAISAHCWLIDSSDDQTYTSTAKVPKQQQQKSQQQHLTLAMMKQSAQQQQQLPPTKVSHHDLTDDLRTNSLRLEKILKKSDPFANALDDRTQTLSTTQVSAPEIHQLGRTLPTRLHQQHRHLIYTNSSEERERDEHPALLRNGPPSLEPERASSAVLRLSALLTLISSIVKRPKCLKTSQSSQSVSQLQSNGQANLLPLNSVSGSLPTTGGPYTLAISSSSSTSAYVTESGSHQSSSGASSALNRLQLHQQRNSTEPPILLSQLRVAAGKVAGSSAGSSSIFYSTSGLSNSTTQPSSHGYEYCSDQPFSETKFVLDERLETPVEPEMSEEHSGSGDGTGSSRASKLTSTQQLHPQLLMSDSELISAGSDGGFPTLRRIGDIGPSGMPSTTKNARRHKCCLSFKNWIKGGPSDHEEPVLASETGEAARYKTLRSSRSPGLLRNILSLAKADRVFRWRLVASLIVSAVLIALVCLLVGLLYVRSSTNQRNKPSLLIDDSDYDLTWIWPNEQQPPAPPQKIGNSPDRASLDSVLRSHLQVVERSEHLNQFQLTMVYLTNLQLTSDNFIDISRLSRHLAPLNSTYNGQAISLLQLNETDQELVSLVLLSNLYWPLVKWKHENQQSVSGFLSFALPSTPVTGAQTLRNLLSGLLFSETIPKVPDNLHPNLSQFIRLYSLLKSSSLYIISCSYWLTQEHAALPQLKQDFCNDLILRYRRMMLTLSRLDQDQRTKLQNQLDMGLELGQPKWPRNLAGFFLDRLTTLDPEIIAFSVVASADDSLINLDTNYTLVSLLGPDFPLTMRNNERAELLSRWQSADSLFDLVKLVIGSATERATEGSGSPDVEVDFSLMTDLLGEGSHVVEALLYPWTANQLPPFIIPKGYDLFLHPNLTTRFIAGMVKIEFQLDYPTNFIVLHCSNLNLIELNIWLKQTGPQAAPDVHPSSTTALKKLTVRRILINPELEQLYVELQERLEPWTPLYEDQEAAQQAPTSFNFANELPLKDISKKRNQFLISISFNKTNLMQASSESGLEFVNYGDPYALPEAELKLMMYTKFEPNNARRLFPAFDEPHLKARFQLNLVHEQHHQVLFNAPKREKVQYTSDGLHQMSVFEQVPVPLSTYLVAFIICDAQNIKSITSRATQLQLNQPGVIGRQLKHVQVQVLAQFEQLGQAEFASQLVPDLLQFYQSLFQFPYPLEKLDLVAIPRASFISKSIYTEQKNLVEGSSSSIDTMENLGLIWFKSNLLLIDPNLISQDLVERVAMIISHQLAHQFFGNVVSLNNWQDFWLYEALCHYLESVALSNIQPDWKLDEQFIVTSILDTLTLEPTDANLLATETELDSVESNDQSVPISQPFLSSNIPVPLNSQFESTTTARKSVADYTSYTVGPDELRRKSAILHMLILNLISTDEARARLLRRCLHLYKYTSMSVSQFWYQFSEFLLHSDKAGYISDLDRIVADDERKDQTIVQPASETLHLELTNPNQASTGNRTSNLSPEHSIERVVFVRNHSLNRRNLNNEEDDKHNIQTRAKGFQRRQNKLELVANAWLERSGFPLVTVTAYRDKLHLRQERFSYDRWPTTLEGQHFMNQPTVGQKYRDRRSNGLSEVQDDIWPIPLMMVSRFNQRNARFFWFNKRQMEVPLIDSSSHQTASSTSSADQFQLDGKRGSGNAWYKLNVNQSSLIRVNYDERNWEALTELLIRSHYSNHVLGSLDRANLLDDVFTLMRHGRLSLGIAMNLTLYLEVAERDYMPWSIALSHLDQMQTLLNQNPLWNRYVLKLIRPISSVIGWKDDGPHLMRKLRRNLFSLALQSEDEKTISKAKQEFKSWYKNGRFIVPNLQELVYVAGVRYGDQQEWFHCWQKYQQLVALDFHNGSSLSNLNRSYPGDSGLHGIRTRQALLLGAPSIISGISEQNEPNAEVEKRQLLTALTSTRNTWLLEQFLNYSLDPLKIQPYHLKHVLQTLGKNPVAKLYLWRFLRFNWLTFIDKYLSSNEAISFVEAKNNYQSYLSNLNPQDNHQVLETLIVESTRHFGSKLDYDDVKNFFEVKLKQLQERLNVDSISWSPAIEKAIQQSLRIIRSNIYWRDHIEPKMIKWLTHYDGAS